MVHVHGAQAQQLAQATRGVDPAELVAVAVDVGKHAAMALVCDFTGELLARPFEFPMTMAGVWLLVERVQLATSGRAVRLVGVGVEAAGHDHQPLVSTAVLPADWQLVQVNPTQVASQRQLAGRRRLKTDALDLVASSDLLGAGHGAGHRVLARRWVSWLGGWPTGSGGLRPGPPSRTSSWARSTGPSAGGVAVSGACTTPRLAGWCWPSSPPGSAQRARVAGLQQAAATQGSRSWVAERLVAAATVAIPTDQAPMAQTIIDRDLTLLAAFDAQVAQADKHLAGLLPQTPFAVLCSGPGWPVVRAATYGLGSATRHGGPAPSRWIGPAGAAQQPTPRPVAAMTAPSAGKARSPCAGPSSRWGGAVAAGPRRPRRCRLPGSPRQATRGDRHRHGQSGQPHRLRHGQRPTTLGPQPVQGSSAPRSRSGVPGRSAGRPDQPPPAIWRAHGHAEASLVPGLPSPSRTRTRSADPLPTRGRIGQRWVCRPDQPPPTRPTSTPLNPPAERVIPACARCPLDPTHSQLANEAGVALDGPHPIARAGDHRRTA
jgi:transposase